MASVDDAIAETFDIGLRMRRYRAKYLGGICCRIQFSAFHKRTTQDDVLHIPCSLRQIIRELE